MAQRKRKKIATQPNRTARVRGAVWVLLAVAVASMAYLGLRAAPGSGHPEPRADITADGVVPAEQFAGDAYVQEVYKFARAIPNVLDGLHCYCECAANFGHQSLLTCFESDHGSHCGICLQEAAIAYQMTQQGATLDEIRAQIDARMAG